VACAVVVDTEREIVALFRTALDEGVAGVTLVPVIRAGKHRVELLLTIAVVFVGDLLDVFAILCTIPVPEVSVSIDFLEAIAVGLCLLTQRNAVGSARNEEGAKTNRPKSDLTTTHVRNGIRASGEREFMPNTLDEIRVVCRQRDAARKKSGR